MRALTAVLGLAAVASAAATSPACAASCGAVTPWTRPANGTVPAAPTATALWEHAEGVSDLVSFPAAVASSPSTPTSDGGASTGVHSVSTFYMWGGVISDALQATSLGVSLPHTVSFAFRAASTNAVGATNDPALLSSLSVHIATVDPSGVPSVSSLADVSPATLTVTGTGGDTDATGVDLGPQTDITALNAWTTHTATFTLPSTCTSCSLFFAVVQADTTSTGSHSGNEYVFANVTITRPSVAVPAKTLWPSAKFSTADIYKAPTPADLWDAKTACPHLESGLSLWHEAATWGGSVPAAGSSPTIPANTHVLVCSCSLPSDAAGAAAPFTLVTVPSTSSLIFDDAPITMHVGSIVGSGRVAAGSSTCRQDQEMSITFHGTKTTVLQGRPQPTSDNTKGLVVSGTGTLDLHGRRFFPTWTRLLATVQPGERHVYLQDGVNWEVGQRILVTTSHHLDGAVVHQNEVRVITGISTDGTVLYVDEAFTHQHWSGEEYQTEVGLLSRVLTMQGAEGDSSVATGGFGGHVMWTGSATGRVTGTRFTRMGQMNVLARYPVHMHLVGETNGGSWISDNAVEGSFFRCAVVHGTYTATVTENVCYDITGHAIFTSEDGPEERNTISYNLVAHIHTIGAAAAGTSDAGEVIQASTTLTIPADRAASGLWITNAYNNIIGNAVSGGWTGYFHPNLPAYVGQFENSPTPANNAPENRPTLTWAGNTAHSSGYDWEYGACVYVGGNLVHDATPQGTLVYTSGRDTRNTVDGTTGADATMTFQHTRVWLCNQAITHWGSRSTITNMEVTDSGGVGGEYGTTTRTGVVITAASGNDGAVAPPLPSPTPSPSSSPSTSPTPSASASPSPSLSPSATVGTSPAASPSADPSPTPVATPSPSQSAAASPASTAPPSPAASSSPAASPGASVSPSPPAATNSPTPSPAASAGATVDGAVGGDDATGDDDTTGTDGQASSSEGSLQSVGGAGGVVGIILALLAVGIIAAAIVFRHRIPGCGPSPTPASAPKSTGPLNTASPLQQHKLGGESAV